MGDGFSKVTLPDFSYVAPADATFVKKNFISPFDAKKLEQAMKRHFKEVDNYKTELAEQEKKYNSVEDIITNDDAAPKNLDKHKMTEMIMDASTETGVDPVIIACIVKRESHFNQNVGVKSGSGLMQVTSLPLKDMYQRPQFFDKNLKKYGSWEKIVAAKKKDPSLDLGGFGEMLYKYGSPEKLLAAARKDPQLNLKVGSYLFRAYLNQAGGNLEKALQNYNGSSHKVLYAKAVKTYINEANSKKNTTEFTA